MKAGREGSRVWRQGLKASPKVVVAQTRGRQGGRGAGFGGRVWRLIPWLWWLKRGEGKKGGVQGLEAGFGC